MRWGDWKDRQTIILLLSLEPNSYSQSQNKSILQYKILLTYFIKVWKFSFLHCMHLQWWKLLRTWLSMWWRRRLPRIWRWEKLQYCRVYWQLCQRHSTRDGQWYYPFNDSSGCDRCGRIIRNCQGSSENKLNVDWL